MHYIKTILVSICSLLVFTIATQASSITTHFASFKSDLKSTIVDDHDRHELGKITSQTKSQTFDPNTLTAITVTIPTNVDNLMSQSSYKLAHHEQTQYTLIFDNHQHAQAGLQQIKTAYDQHHTLDLDDLTGLQRTIERRQLVTAHHTLTIKKYTINHRMLFLSLNNASMFQLTDH